MDSSSLFFLRRSCHGCSQFQLGFASITSATVTIAGIACSQSSLRSGRSWLVNLPSCLLLFDRGDHFDSLFVACDRLTVTLSNVRAKNPHMKFSEARGSRDMS